MPFAIQLCLIIFLYLLNVSFYVWTFFDAFALRNKEFYDIISMFNDFIFISCFLASISSLRKSKLISVFIFLSIPILYTFILILNFR